MATLRKPGSSSEEKEGLLHSAFPDVPTHTNAPASVEMRPARRIVPQAQVAQHQGGFDDIAGISATDITAEVVPEATPYGGYPVLHAPADKYGPSGVAATHARPSSADHFGPSGPATRNPLQASHTVAQGPVGPERTPTEAELIVPVEFNADVAGRIARDRQRAENYQDRVAERSARQRDREEMALLRGATARARVSDRQGFDCEATAYPIETLPATDLKNIYGINKTDETQAKVEEETREVRLRARPASRPSAAKALLETTISPPLTNPNPINLVDHTVWAGGRLPDQRIQVGVRHWRRRRRLPDLGLQVHLRLRRVETLCI
uniref:Uncharacterized protein n=1 Tax=Phaeomonas parva TaxID=124430 RepID=A0A7S1U273_9STRA|mmetsp:Transcript_28391/g.90842  ORF Transcript_28391/g.90842 Transcript_28391/m.90842 type:complete len:323 (+) Transcript_28391:253-1221(+)